MADITPLIASDRQVIQGYGQDGFKISGRSYRGPVMVFPDRVVAWTIAKSGQLTPADFQFFTATASIDVLLLGCGAKGFQPSATIRSLLKSHSITIDAMDTGAACRTYNVLLADGRRIAAALLPPL